MMCCLVASALSATFAFTIARAYGVRAPEKEKEPEPPDEDAIEAQVIARPDIRHRGAPASFM